MPKKKLILASGSTSRISLLKKTGIEFVWERSDYDEDMSEKIPPEDLCQKLALGKAMDVAKKHQGENAIIIGADSFGIIDGKLIGKPSDKKDAKKVLKLISGRKHELITGFAIVDAKNGKSITDYDIATVWIKAMTEKEIDGYIETKEPLDKAPSYTIEGIGSLFIEKIHGNCSTVIGLPIQKLNNRLHDLGINLIEYHSPTPS